jgi:hypothetical protein
MKKSTAKGKSFTPVSFSVVLRDSAMKMAVPKALWTAAAKLPL